MIKFAIYAYKSKLKLHSIVNYYLNLNPFDYILCYFYNIVQIMSTYNKSAILKVSFYGPVYKSRTLHSDALTSDENISLSTSKNTMFSMTMATFFNVVKSKRAEIKRRQKR